METIGLSELRLTYKQAVREWIGAIRVEELLATTNHSMIAMEEWDDAHFKEQDAQTTAQHARDAYKEGLRDANYGILKIDQTP
jgi:hypothetical protein